jgi:hypothetical protein
MCLAGERHGVVARHRVVDQYRHLAVAIHGRKAGVPLRPLAEIDGNELVVESLWVMNTSAIILYLQRWLAYLLICKASLLQIE